MLEKRAKFTKGFTSLQCCKLRFFKKVFLFSIEEVKRNYPNFSLAFSIYWTFLRKFLLDLTQKLLLSTFQFLQRMKLLKSLQIRNQLFQSFRPFYNCAWKMTSKWAKIIMLGWLFCVQSVICAVKYDLNTFGDFIKALKNVLSDFVFLFCM